jgi:NAD(P)-dependent dehydrogenase (short-subunit alcohol dehydrogenase family)
MEAQQPALDGKLAVVTGANTGIGYCIARELARRGARVVLACRKRERAQAAAERIVRETGRREADYLHLDLSSLMTVRNFVSRFRVRHQRLDILVNNAGIWTDKRMLSADGIELTWATNVLGPFLLTELISPLLRSSAPSRVINLASELAYGLKLDDVQFDRRRFGGRRAYAQSKQANRMLTREQARRLDGTGVSVNSMHPGLVASELFRDLGGPMGRLIQRIAARFGRTPEQGADTAVWLASDPGVQARSGEFWVNRKPRRCRFRNQAREGALWALCEEMAGGGQRDGKRERVAGTGSGNG